MSAAPRRRRLGIFEKRERWSLTPVGWLLLVGFMALTGFAGIKTIYPFLALHHRVDSQLLVVEGWIPDYGLEELRSEFEKHRYKLIVITGSPILKGQVLAEYNNYADLTRAALLKQGWDPNTIVAVPSSAALRDRTYTSALALRDWMEKSGQQFDAFNVLSRAAHCRRTWLLYQLAFKGKAKVGMISGIELRYDGNNWWKSSEGVREVIDETIAYIYAKFFFRPSRR
jgi:hypothetical protein